MFGPICLFPLTLISVSVCVWGEGVLLDSIYQSKNSGTIYLPIREQWRHLSTNQRTAARVVKIFENVNLVLASKFENFQELPSKYSQTLFSPHSNLEV